MPSNPNFSYSSAATPAFVYAGTFLQTALQPNRPDGYVYRSRTAVPAIYNATQAGGVGFDGANLLGVKINGADFQPAAAANLGAWITAINAISAMSLVGGVFSNPAGTTVRFTGPASGAQFTLAALQPDSPDLTLGAFTLTADTGIASPTIRPGMGVVFKDYMWELEAPLPTSTIGSFAGVVSRDSLLSDATIIGLTGSLPFPRALVDENRCQVSDKGRMTLLAANGHTVTAGAPVYLGRIPAEAGYWYKEDDGGNTRLLIPNATWAQAGTGDTAAEKGLTAIFK